MHLPRDLPRRAAAAAGAALLVIGSALATAAPAAAHDELVSTSPAKDATLTAVPDSVVLTFSEEVQSLGAAVVVTDSEGARVADGAPAVDGLTVTQALLPDVAGGTVTVAFRVVSSDGHPVTGSYSFDLDLPESSATSPASTEPSEPTEPTASQPEPSPSASLAGAPAEGPPVGLLVGGAVLLIAVGAAVAVGLRRGGGSSS